MSVFQWIKVPKMGLYYPEIRFFSFIGTGKGNLK
jgi:hypothetical protein